MTDVWIKVDANKKGVCVTVLYKNPEKKKQKKKKKNIQQPTVVEFNFVLPRLFCIHCYGEHAMVNLLLLLRF